MSVTQNSRAELFVTSNYSSKLIACLLPPIRSTSPIWQRQPEIARGMPKSRARGVTLAIKNPVWTIGFDLGVMGWSG
jgi:hypothetical protein